MRLTRELPLDILDEILGNLETPELIACALLCKSVLPLVQSRLYRCLDVDLDKVAAIVAYSLDLLVHTQTLWFSYTHKRQDVSYLAIFFDQIAALGHLRNATLNNKRILESHRQTQDLGPLFGSMRTFLLSITSLRTLNITIDPPKNTEGTAAYADFLEIAIGRQCLQSVSLRLGRLPGFSFPEGIISSPIKSLNVFIEDFQTSAEAFEKIAPRFDLSGLRQLVLSTTNHLTEQWSDLTRKVFESSPLESLAIRADRVGLLPSFLAGLSPSRALSLHIVAYGTAQDFKSLLSLLASSLDALSQRSLTSLTIVMVCTSVRVLNVVVSSADWHTLRSAIGRFEDLAKVTIHIVAHSADEVSSLTAHDRSRIESALKEGISPTCHLDVVGGASPKLVP
ncbi:hypothetical protein DL96DRAFT_1821825 [Flagelloscypha sp. PMI_526]|nr:hypothetical protein DL96DRAFT_1821825 [Flagelloscypha sp. PMI_526]